MSTNTTEQTATLPAADTSNARNWGDKLETIETKRLVAFDGAEIVNPVDARFYMARHSDGASPVRCSVWIRTRDGRYFAGKGTASGYGYHKQSAALQDALDSAGIQLARRIDGVGDSAIRTALEAVGDACGYTGCPRTIV